METYTTQDGIECVVWTDKDGFIHSMVKQAYDEQQAALSTPNV